MGLLGARVIDTVGALQTLALRNIRISVMPQLITILYQNHSDNRIL